MKDIEIREITPADAAAVRGLFAGLSDRDRTLMDEDMTAPGAVERWISDPGLRFVAVDGDTAVGIVVIVPGVAWREHVARLRIVVDPSRRRLGIGRALARRGLVEAVGAGHTKLFVEVLADDEPTVAMFTAIGFEPEGILRDHVRDQSGAARDLLLLSHFVDDDWAAMATTGLDELVAEE